MKVPVSLIVDDPAPIISVYYEHVARRTTSDGRPIIPTFPNDFLDQFCDIVDKHGIKGKFTVIPMPGNKGDIVNGLEGVDRSELDEWLNTVKTRLLPHFTVGPEMLTHHKAVDLATGEALPMNERDWASTQDRTTLTPYISKALAILKDAGFFPIGVTSPWDFGIEVEDEYEESISRAVQATCGSNEAWFFLRQLRNMPKARPWIALSEQGRTLVSIPGTLKDCTWQTIDCPETSDEYVSRVADEIITADGKEGEFVRVFESGGYPIILSHWQSLMSNGLRTGLRVLDVIASRINLHYSDKVEWMSFEEIMRFVVANPEDHPIPECRRA
jgi:hypothetical protein